jgi:hypothetical protein
VLQPNASPGRCAPDSGILFIDGVVHRGGYDPPAPLAP